MRLSHIIVTKGRPSPLRDALRSSLAALSPQDELIVVDGDPERSAQPVVEELRAAQPDANVVYLPSEPGMTLQRNVGIDAARGEIVVFTDDDVTFEPRLFDDLVDAYRDPTVVGATGLIVSPAPPPRIGSDSSSRLRWLLVGGGRQGTMTSFGFRRPIVATDQPRDVEFMPGCLMTARRELAAEVRFDQRLASYALGEDDDFSYRLSRRGRLRYQPSLTVHHHEIGFHTMDRRARDRRQIINRTYLFRKNFAQTRRARIAFVLLVGMMFVHRALNREWDGIRGLADGLGHIRRHGPLNPGDGAQPASRAAPCANPSETSR